VRAGAARSASALDELVHLRDIERERQGTGGAEKDSLEGDHCCLRRGLRLRGGEAAVRSAMLVVTRKRDDNRLERRCPIYTLQALYRPGTTRSPRHPVPGFMETVLVEPSRRSAENCNSRRCLCDCPRAPPSIRSTGQPRHYVVVVGYSSVYQPERVTSLKAGARLGWSGVAPSLSPATNEGSRAYLA
jgi:hypothetical protein